MRRLEKLIRPAARGIILAFVLLLAALGLSLLALNYILGIGVTRRTPQRATRSMKNSQRPSATVRVTFAGSSGQELAEPVEIAMLSDLYASVGATSKDFADWESKYGVDSLGITPDGRLFIPAYPTLSKVAWMYLNPVPLTRTEAVSLLNEIERAQAHAINDRVSQELADIAVLARTAISKDAVLTFGLP